MNKGLRTRPSRPGILSVRARLAMSYALLVAVAGFVLLGVVALFLLRYIPDRSLYYTTELGTDRWAPSRDDLIRAFTPAAAWALLALFVIGAIGGWILAGRMLRPLEKIGAAARLAAHGSLSHRIGLQGPRDEFREVADIFDTMLARIESDVDRQRRFAANASHELRTPLAITRALLDVADTDPGRDVDRLLTQLRVANDRAIDLTEALLTLSRIETSPPALVPTDLSLVAEEAVEVVHALADRHGVRMELEGDPVSVRGDAGLLNQLALNLVQNAIVHNHPSGGTAWVRTEAGDSAAMLIVENTGSLVEESALSGLTEPFERGAERTRRDDHVGAGLGLAIASSIVDALGGTLTLTPRDDGGLRVVAAFPAELA